MNQLYRSSVINKPFVILTLLLIVVGYFSLYLNNFKLDASSDSLLLEDDDDLRIFRETSERYEGQDFLFITFTPHSGDLFSDESLQVIRKLQNDLLQLPKTDTVFSLLDAPLLKLVGGKLSEVASNYKTLNAALDGETIDRDKAKAELTQSPIFKELIINQKGDTTALQVLLKNDEEYLRLQKEKNRLLLQKMREGSNEDLEQKLNDVLTEYDQVKSRNDKANHENIQAVREIMDQYRTQGTLHLGGISMIADDMITFIGNDLVYFGLGVLGFLIVMLSVIFRQMRWVVLPLVSCLFAGMIMVGLLGLVGWRVTVISSNFISLMLILTMSMNVHLIVRYRQLYLQMPNASQKELVFETARKMVWPCLYTALTTMIGFASLVFSGIKPVINFGWMMTIGLGVTFLTSFLLFPAILSLLKKIPVAGKVDDEVPFTAILAGLTERFGGSVLFVSLLLAIGSVIGISQLKVENSFINYFRSSTEIYQGLKLIDDELGGTTPVEVLLKFKEVELEEDDDFPFADESDAAEDDDEFMDFDDLYAEETTDPAEGFFTSDKIDRIKKVHDYLEQNPAVGKILSLASVLRLAEDLNEGEPFNAFELAVINKRMPEELKEAMIDPYVSFTNNEARISLRIKDSLPDLRRKELLENIHRDLHEELNIPRDEYQITGLLVLYNNMLQSLFQSQIQTLGVVMLGIALMLLVLFRSVKLAIIGIMPNILAAGIILGLMGLLNIPLDLMTITIAAITIGIAVDNSIHYIYRFREELPAQSGDYVKTMYVCHANIGRAVFYTAITIFIGFSILIFSNFIPTIYFGLLTALAMSIALFAALTLLPKLILWQKPF